MRIGQYILDIAQSSHAKANHIYKATESLQKALVSAKDLCEVAVGVGVIVVIVEASAPKVYRRVTLASASTLSGSVVRTLRGGEGLPNVFSLVASSLGHLCRQCSIVCGSSLQRGHRGPAEGSRRLA